MPRDRRPLPPLDRESLDRMALRYVERFATSRGKFAFYLRRKIRERGWDGPAIDPDAVATRFAELGYIDDRAFAGSRARAMARRGLGERRIVDAFRAAGIAAADADAIAPEIADGAIDAALALARRKRIGPYAVDPADRERRQKQLAQMVRGGHSFALARRIVEMAPGTETESLRDDF